jgi:DNA primase
MAKDVDLIKEKLDLTDFLRSYMTLSPAGKNLRGLCPFHQEKTPSFMVSPERKMWHCFGCGLGGDVIKFAMLYDHLEFPEALRFLAEKAGISIQTMNPAQQREFGILYDLHEEAKNFYKGELAKNQPAQKYLKDRGIKPETIEEFELGYSPGGDSLTVHLIKKGHSVDDVMRAGLAHKNTSGLFRDKFFERVIFPIANQVGKTVAFTGRILPEAEAKYKDSPTPPPKYLNSPETPIFNKSRTLYGFDHSKKSISDSRTVVLVEGQMDFLGAWQAGIKNVTAVSGTGLTPYHLEKLRRFADTALVSFDNDAAGLKALERTLGSFNSFDFHVKVIDLGKFKDPADAAQSDPGFLKRAIDSAKPAFEYIFGVYFRPSVWSENDIPKQKRIIRHLLGMVKSLKSAVEENIWIKDLSKRSGISESALTEELGASEEEPSYGGGESDGVGEVPLPDYVDAVAKRLVALALTNANFMDILKANSQLLPDAYQKMLADQGGEARGFLELQSAYEFANAEPDRLEKEFKDLMKRIQTVSLKDRQLSLKHALKRAQSVGDDDSVNKILNDFSDTTKQINNLNK